MRNASVSITSLEVFCPHCGAPVASHTGSHLWVPEELSRLNMEPNSCEECGKEFAMPPTVCLDIFYLVTNK